MLQTNYHRKARFGIFSIRLGSPSYAYPTICEKWSNQSRRNLLATLLRLPNPTICFYWTKHRNPKLWFNVLAREWCCVFSFVRQQSCLLLFSLTRFKALMVSVTLHVPANFNEATDWQTRVIRNLEKDGRNLNLHKSRSVYMLFCYMWKIKRWKFLSQDGFALCNCDIFLFSF